MIIKNLLKILGNSTIYVKFSSTSIYVQHVENKTVIEEKPLAAIQKVHNKEKITAVGSDALKVQAEDSQNTHIQNVFEKHPRAVLSNFELAAAAISYFVQKILPKNTLLRPVIILHPTEKLDGGISQLELKALTELGIQIGARKVYVWQGHTLTTRQLLDSLFLEQNSLKQNTVSV